MDILTEWYSNPENIKRLTNWLRRYVHVDGSFRTQEDVDITIEDAIWKAYSNLRRTKYDMQNLLYCKSKTIIYRAAINNAKTELRERRRRTRISLSAESEYDNSIDDLTLMLINEVNSKFYLHLIPSPDKYAEINELREILNNSIDELPENQKESFLLWTQGHTYNQMSVILEKPVGTLKSNVYRARKKLRSNETLIKHYEARYL